MRNEYNIDDEEVPCSSSTCLHNCLGLRSTGLYCWKKYRDHLIIMFHGEVKRSGVSIGLLVSVKKSKSKRASNNLGTSLEV